MDFLKYKISIPVTKMTENEYHQHQTLNKLASLLICRELRHLLVSSMVWPSLISYSSRSVSITHLERLCHPSLHFTDVADQFLFVKFNGAKNTKTAVNCSMAATIIDKHVTYWFITNYRHKVLLIL